MICENQKGIKNRSFFFLIPFLFLTSLLSIKTFKKVNVQDIKIHGSELFSREDIVSNSSLDFPTSLIFIKTKFISQECFSQQRIISFWFKSSH